MSVKATVFFMKNNNKQILKRWWNAVEIQKVVTVNIGVFIKWLVNMCMYSRYANSSYAIFYAGKAEGISRCITVTKWSDICRLVWPHF